MMNNIEGNSMKNVIIFGAGGSGRKCYKKINQQYCILAFADNYKTGKLFDLPIITVEEIKEYKYDYVMIASVSAVVIKKQLIKSGIDESKILSLGDESFAIARVNFLEKFAQEIYRKEIQGAVAEAGVFQGDFSAEINQNFPDRKLYLFDTFEGFDDRDLSYEDNYESNPGRGDYFAATSTDLVISKLKYPMLAEIKKGYVPETFVGIEDTFCFVSLDMDLYKPTQRAMEWFWPRLNSGGVLLIHDYFDETGTFPNLKQAVIEFVETNDIFAMPIGDNLSIVLVKS